MKCCANNNNIFKCVCLVSYSFSYSFSEKNNFLTSKRVVIMLRSILYINEKKLILKSVNII